MATNLRELAESHLEQTLEGMWSLPINFVTPDGDRVDGLRGQILYDQVRTNPETGEVVIVTEPIITVRRSTMLSDVGRVPAAGENWLVEIPESPSESADKASYVISSTRAPEGGRSVGFVRIYLQEVDQL